MRDEQRWKQRYQIFGKAFAQFNEAVLNIEKLNTLEKEGLIQRFEYTFELAWKTMKDYLEANGVNANFPREVIKESFRYGIIEGGEVWMDMLEKRNLLAHTYNEERFNLALEKIKNEYYGGLLQVYKYLGEKL
ncbi:nucleotidyltransferase substrate binding protein, HI0074 family [Anaerobranca californiensis DSM 14826]|uniref:Nucleotidyltransferase substrate binding protein, HI0074 family n=1 Tax=Anaerobranca californiensis DSM 14826 TaxID=1120989 RepID=A0A1M6RP35_9FIRM|nr:nucleotidyltransferase substrate binding protein [Anaerobranca californiensis]SHK34219.1 nucleotidyltransferase substrate binding protein, HI0074 family [Anaerobranca californiensis DSM 14826]